MKIDYDQQNNNGCAILYRVCLNVVEVGTIDVDSIEGKYMNYIVIRHIDRLYMFVNVWLDIDQTSVKNQLEVVKDLTMN